MKAMKLTEDDLVILAKLLPLCGVGERSTKALIRLAQLGLWAEEFSEQIKTGLQLQDFSQTATEALEERPQGRENTP